MVNNRTISGILYRLRDIRISKVYHAIDRYCRGRVLDVGGRDFYMRVQARKLEISSWTTCDISADYKLNIDDGIYSFVVGDGCSLDYDNETFDTVINMQVLEHVFEPIKMFAEIARVLRKGGHGIFLIPQTSVLHYAPNHYYNFTRFWIEQAAQRSDMEVVELMPLGGMWSTIASQLFSLVFQIANARGMRVREYKRNFFFYLFLPFMLIYVLINIPVLMLFSLGDLQEGSNNHLFVVRKQ